jgi:hypothetical protein
MFEQKWAGFADKVENLITAYDRIKKERDELKNELVGLQQKTTKLTRGGKEDVLLKDRIKILEEERKVVQEKVKNLLKILKEY